MPTTAIRTSPSGARTISTMRCQGERSTGASNGRRKWAQHLAIHALGVVADGHGIDRVHIQRRDHRGLAHVAEARDLAPLRLGDLPVAPAQRHLRLDADVQQFLHRMLRGLGLELPRTSGCRARASGARHRALRPQFIAQLPDRLEKRQALDVAHGPPISISAKSSPSVSRVIASLIASVMCGITCTVRPGSRRAAPWRSPRSRCARWWHCPIGAHAPR